MQEFFGDWKIKLGIATLALATILICGATRAARTDDLVIFNLGRMQCAFASTQSVFRAEFSKLNRYAKYEVLSWESSPADRGLGVMTDGSSVNWEWCVAESGFQLSYGRSWWGQSAPPIVLIAFPYWIAVPLLFVSFWLLMSQSRGKRTPTPASENTQKTVRSPMGDPVA